MPKIPARKQLERTMIEFGTFDGKRSGRQYLLLKGYVRKVEFFQAFAPVELKGAALDILDRKDSKLSRKGVNSNELARDVWSKRN